MTCLLIDDDPDDQEIFQIALEQAFPDAVCWCASDCQKAIDQLDKKLSPIPDYIFVDWNLPFIEGTECIYALRQISDLREVYIIILSGLTPSFSKSEMDKLGIKKILKKQSSIPQLSEEIALIINSR